MGMGAITWACLLLTAHQAPADDVFMNARAFEIPIVLNRQGGIRRLVLYVSEDGGQSWQVQQYAQPGQKSFLFQAKRDGRYWFIVGTEDQQGRTIPADPNRVRPNQRVVVDTLAPRVQVTASRLPGGEVLAHWTVQEEYPDPRTLRLDYHTDAMRPDQWTPLPVEPLAGPGEKQFNPGGAGEVRVRVHVKDRAENVGMNEAVVAGAGGAPAVAGGEGPGFGVVPTVRADQAGAPGLLASRQSPRPPADPPPPDGPHGVGSVPGGPGAVAATSAPSPAAFAPETPRGALPPVKIVKKREVKLEFEAAKVGPSGLGGADVYVTINEGATWSRVPGELPVALSSPADPRGGPVRGSVSVQLPAEGTVYGFIVAVKSKAGLGRPAPKAGEPPQVRVELDATAPRAELIKPAPDPAQQNTLILAWTALDRNLPPNPVTLEWAERKEGPWTVIGGGPLPNTGQYPWHLPDGIPSRVYLRLTVCDSAGNAAKAETDKPELIDLSVPETNIIGVGPVVR